MVQIVLNADDFGASAAINAAIIRAHRQGVLTSASLMVTGDAAPVAKAREFHQELQTTDKEDRFDGVVRIWAYSRTFPMFH